jgi:hypothetical protein
MPIIAKILGTISACETGKFSKAGFTLLEDYWVSLEKSPSG